MINSLTALRASIKSYYNRSRRGVLLRASVRNKLIEVQTEIKCSKEEFAISNEIELLIQDQVKIFAECISKFDNTEIVRNEYYKTRVEIEPEIEPDITCFFNVFDEFVKSYSGTMAPGHLRNFMTVQRSLEIFTSNPTLNCDEVTPQFVNEYTYYLINNGVENSTIKGYLKRIKRVVRFANEHLKIKIDLPLDLITQLKEKSNFVVFLDRKEVQQFSEVQTLTKGEQEVKIGFLFRCYTGIRFSEMPYIDINNLDGNSLSFYIPKTSKSHTIPLNMMGLEIIKQVKRFNPISQQKENQYLKVLARRAKIDRPVQKVKLSGSVSTVETHPKWKLCSSHTARRTWARIAYEAGIDILKISRYIGHSDIATTLKYKGHKDTDFDELTRIFET